MGPFVDAWLVQSEQRALTLVEQRTGRPFTLPDADTIRLWMRKALALAARGTDEIGDEAALPESTSHRPASTLLLTGAGPLAAFAAGTLFVLILLPAVMAGWGDANRRSVRTTIGARGDKPLVEATSSESEPSAPEEQPDPGGLGRHRPAAR